MRVGHGLRLPPTPLPLPLLFLPHNKPTHASPTHSVLPVNLLVGSVEDSRSPTRRIALSSIRLTMAGLSVVNPHSQVLGAPSLSPPPLRLTLAQTFPPPPPLNELLHPRPPAESQNLATKCA